MKTWQILFKMDRAGERGSQGGRTGSTEVEDFADEDADNAAAEEGAEELEEEEGPEEEADPEDSDEERSEEEEDPEEEEEEGDEEEEEEQEEEETEASGFKFKDPKTGDFDFKRISKVLGGDELEKAFKEQHATITRTFQELKTLKDQAASPQAAEQRNKAGFFDHLMANNPVIHREVLRVLHGGPAGQEPAGGGVEIPGLNPDDPLAKPFTQLLQTVNGLQTRLQQEDRAKQQERVEREQRELRTSYVNGLRKAGASFKQLMGRDATEAELNQVADEMLRLGIVEGERLIPSLFLEQIRLAERARLSKARKVKKALPRGGSSRRAAPGGTKKKSKEEIEDELWNEHMSGGNAD